MDYNSIKEGTYVIIKKSNEIQHLVLNDILKVTQMAHGKEFMVISCIPIRVKSDKIRNSVTFRLNKTTPFRHTTKIFEFTNNENMKLLYDDI